MYVCICFFPQTGVEEAFSREEEELRVESASEYNNFNFNKWFFINIIIIIIILELVSELLSQSMEKTNTN